VSKETGVSSLAGASASSTGLPERRSRSRMRDLRSAIRSCRQDPARLRDAKDWATGEQPSTWARLRTTEGCRREAVWSTERVPEVRFLF
jgi:hypothetical protein